MAPTASANSRNVTELTSPPVPLVVCAPLSPILSKSLIVLTSGEAAPGSASSQIFVIGYLCEAPKIHYSGLTRRVGSCDQGREQSSPTLNSSLL